MIGQTILIPEPGPETPESVAEPGQGPRPAVKEVGGREGPDPTRYGDWEKNGRCIDF
jgi:hypothetical protein